jgi:hypothetical protein
MARQNIIPGRNLIYSTVKRIFKVNYNRTSVKSCTLIIANDINTINSYRIIRSEIIIRFNFRYSYIDGYVRNTLMIKIETKLNGIEIV